MLILKILPLFKLAMQAIAFNASAGIVVSLAGKWRIEVGPTKNKH